MAKVPQTFFVPWSDIDPSLQHGGIPEVVGDGYVGPNLGDNPTTRNRDIRYIFDVIRDHGAALSMHPNADLESPVVRNVVNEVLKSINLIMERILDRTRTLATSFLILQHATPPSDRFELRPIRYPLRNPFMADVIYWYLGAMAETAEMGVNGWHSCLDPKTAHAILAPFFHVKANIIRDYFDQEVEGEIAMDELVTLFNSGELKNIYSPGESRSLPDTAGVADALKGVSLIQWFPADADWSIFADKQSKAFVPERIFQPEGSSGTTEDIAPERPV